MDGRRTQKRPKLKIPYFPDGKKSAGGYLVNSIEEKTVADYTKLSFAALEELNLFVFWAYLRDAAIYNWQGTKEGQEYLEKCARMETTKPDKAALRKKYGKNKKTKK